MESNRKVFASADETACDFLIDDYKVEVGGKRKETKQADYVLRDDIDIPDNNIIPLWMLGFEYQKFKCSAVPYLLTAFPLLGQSVTQGFYYAIIRWPHGSKKVGTKSVCPGFFQVQKLTGLPFKVLESPLNKSHQAKINIGFYGGEPSS